MKTASICSKYELGFDYQTKTWKISHKYTSVIHFILQNIFRMYLLVVICLFKQCKKIIAGTTLKTLYAVNVDFSFAHNLVVNGFIS